MYRYRRSIFDSCIHKSCLLGHIREQTGVLEWILRNDGCNCQNCQGQCIMFKKEPTHFKHLPFIIHAIWPPVLFVITYYEGTTAVFIPIYSCGLSNIMQVTAFPKDWGHLYITFFHPEVCGSYYIKPDFNKSKFVSYRIFMLQCYTHLKETCSRISWFFHLRNVDWFIISFEKIPKKFAFQNWDVPSIDDVS